MTAKKKPAAGSGKTASGDQAKFPRPPAPKDYWTGKLWKFPNPTADVTDEGRLLSIVAHKVLGPPTQERGNEAWHGDVYVNLTGVCWYGPQFSREPGKDHGMPAGEGWERDVLSLFDTYGGMLRNGRRIFPDPQDLRRRLQDLLREQMPDYAKRRGQEEPATEEEKVRGFNSSQDTFNLYAAKLAESGLELAEGKALGMGHMTGLAVLKLGLWGKKALPALMLPYFDPWTGETDFARYRALVEPIPKQPNFPKYIQIKGSGTHAYFPRYPGIDWPVLLADPARPLIICEGELKSAKASKEGFPSIALGGVDSFRSQKAGIAFLPELEAINWEGREVFIVFDTDPATKTNKHVAMAIQTLATLLIERGAIVKRVDLPTLQEGRKCGLDDYFVAAGAPAFRELLEAAELLTRSLLEFTEDALALSFAEKFKDTLRYDHTAGAWYRWDDVAWCRDEKQQGLNLARETLQEISAAAKAAGALREKLGKVSTAANVEKFAKATPDFAVTGSIWDTDPFKLGTPGGTLDLRTGTLSAAESWSYITKLAAVAPSETAHCPQWLTFLDQVTGRDAGVIHFLQQWSGHCLSGDTREQALVFVWGPGGNGKSVFLNTIKGILGHYAQAAMMSTFITTYGNKHPTDLASMKGARLVTAVENNSKDVWDEALIKLLTGGEDIRAHHMHKDVFSFKPELKLTIIGNHKPRLMNVSDSTKRRLNFVPFTFKPDDTKIDQELEQKLKLEWPGILRWAIEGCLDWQRRGLDRPKVVLDATAEYFEAEDSFGAWISDSCALGDRYSTGPNKGKLIDSRPSVLRDSYNFWAVSNGEREIDRRRFKAQAELVPGVRYKTVNGVLLVEGIRLLEIEEKRGRAEEGEKRTEEKPGRKTKY